MECENNTQKKSYKKIQQPCATPYRCAEAVAILGDCSDRSRDFGRGCASYATTPRAIRAIPENRDGFRTTVKALYRSDALCVRRRSSASRWPTLTLTVAAFTFTGVDHRAR